MVKILCPTRLVVDATENGIAGAWRPTRAAPRLGYEQYQKEHAIAHTWVTKMKSLSSWGESLNIIQPTPPTTHQHFSVKRCVPAQNDCNVGGYRSVGVGNQVKENNSAD